jgi:putative ABC transport system permease protein
MTRLALNGLRGRRAATLLAGGGLLLGILGFITTASTAQTGRAVLIGEVNRAWKTPYDILVRPAHSRTPLERSAGLLRPNYVSAIYGGITGEQLRRIRSISAVSVAAPVAVVGFVNWPSIFQVQLPTDGSLKIYRVATSSTADAGLSHYPIETRYVAVAKTGTLDLYAPGAPGGPRDGGYRLTAAGHAISCERPVSCVAPKYCEHYGDGTSQCFARKLGPAYQLPVLQPIPIAGIDPQAEAALDGIDRCLTEGRYLTLGDHPRDLTRTTPSGEYIPLESIPVLISTTSFVKEEFTAQIATLSDPSTMNEETRPQRLHDWRNVTAVRRSAQELYRSFLPSVVDYQDPWPMWSGGATTYRRTGPSAVQPVALAPPAQLYVRNYGTGNNLVNFDAEGLLAPPESSDIAFRPITIHTDKSSYNPGTPYRLKQWRALGQYDPACLPQFDSLNGAGGLETYAAPSLRLPDGRELGPTRSMTGYVATPPLVLTNLAGAQWLADSSRFAQASAKAFISVIRVKVVGTEANTPVSRARLARVAYLIHLNTGLDVDVVKGSSTLPVTIDLPAGRFGRPALRATEEWSKKGVTLGFARALNWQNASLLTLLLIGSVLLAGQTAYVSVRRRRPEFGTLRAMGWSSWRLGWLVEMETLALGVVVGLLSVAVAFPLRMLLGVRAWDGSVLTAIPIAVGLCLIAGLIPALHAARGTTTGVMRGLPRVYRSRPPRSAISLSFRDVARTWRLEAIVGVLAVAIGASMVGGVILIAAVLRSHLDATALGTYLSGHVQPFQVILALLSVVIGALALGQIVALGYLERRRHLAALRAFGWPRRQIALIIVGQALSIGLGGVIVGAGALTALATVVGAGAGPFLLALAGAAGVVLVCVALATMVPLALAYGANPSELLRDE